MSKTIGQFGFSVVKMHKDDPAMSPWVQIELTQWGSQNGVPAISAHLMSAAEIDEHIRHLKDDLDAVGRKAKAALSAANEQTRALVGARRHE